MINKIFIDPKLYKRLARLKRASKKALLAAKSAEEIIEEIQRGAVPLMEIGSLTRRRELRLPGCFKFNLGAGYRLITLIFFNSAIWAHLRLYILQQDPMTTDPVTSIHRSGIEDNHSELNCSVEMIVTAVPEMWKSCPLLNRRIF